MKAQAELLKGTGIPSDELPGFEFSPDQLDFLENIELVTISEEWRKVRGILAICITDNDIPEQYDSLLQGVGTCTLDNYSPANVPEQ